MKKRKLTITVILVFCLLFSNISMAFADFNPPTPQPIKSETNDIRPIEDNDVISYVIEPGDPGAGGHLCDYSNTTHIVTASEVLQGQICTNLFWFGLYLLVPESLAFDIMGDVTSTWGVFQPIENDKIIQTWSISYNYVEDTYTYVFREYVYRPTWDGGETLVNSYYFADTYSWYESSYDLYSDNCPH